MSFYTLNGIWPLERQRMNAAVDSDLWRFGSFKFQSPDSNADAVPFSCGRLIPT